MPRLIIAPPKHYRTGRPFCEHVPVLLRGLITLAPLLLLGCPRPASAPAVTTAEESNAFAEGPSDTEKAAKEFAAEPSVSGSLLAGVDVFGVRTVPREDVIEVIGLALGEPADMGSTTFRDELAAARTRLEDRFGFAFVKLSPIAYFAGPDAGKIYITVDVVERGDEERRRFSPEPAGRVADPDGLIAAWTAYEERAWQLMRSGELDLSEGAVCRGGFHCALGFGHPDLEPYEERFIAKVPKRLDELRSVVRRDGNPAKRAAAAFLLAYGNDREKVIDALVPSIDDPSMLVRNNVLRVLAMAQKDAGAALLPLAPLLRALEFPEASDRNKAGHALAYLVGKAPGRFRSDILHEAGDVLLKMAAMSQPNNREPALQILRALSGQDYGADVQAWRRWVDESR
jgi:hypothetical protein